MKINTALIPNFDTMTDEQKVKALLELELTDEAMALENNKLKTSVSKANSEAAEFKRKYLDLLSAEDRRKAESALAEQERAEREKQLQDEIATLKRENTVRDYAERYRQMGYSDELARDTANALADGDSAKVFENGEKYRIEHEKKIRAEIAAGAPKPDGAGSGNNTITKEEIMNIVDTSKRQQAIAEHPELFVNN